MSVGRRKVLPRLGFKADSGHTKIPAYAGILVSIDAEEMFSSLIDLPDDDMDSSIPDFTCYSPERGVHIDGAICNF